MLLKQPPREASANYLRRLLRHGLDIQSVWSVGHGVEPDSERRANVLLAFADRATLEQLRKCDDLREAGVELFVVVDGDAFENAWGPQCLSGSLVRWAWREVTHEHAYYDESHWAAPGEEAGGVVRVRRKAYLVWSRAAELQGTA